MLGRCLHTAAPVSEREGEGQRMRHRVEGGEEKECHSWGVTLDVSTLSESLGCVAILDNVNVFGACAPVHNLLDVAKGSICSRLAEFFRGTTRATLV